MTNCSVATSGVSCRETDPGARRAKGHGPGGRGFDGSNRQLGRDEDGCRTSPCGPKRSRIAGRHGVRTTQAATGRSFGRGRVCGSWHRGDDAQHLAPARDDSALAATPATHARRTRRRPARGSPPIVPGPSRASLSSGISPRRRAVLIRLSRHRQQVCVTQLLRSCFDQVLPGQTRQCHAYSPQPPRQPGSDHEGTGIHDRRRKDRLRRGPDESRWPPALSLSSRSGSFR